MFCKSVLLFKFLYSKRTVFFSFLVFRVNPIKKVRVCMHEYVKTAYRWLCLLNDSQRAGHCWDTMLFLRKRKIQEILSYRWSFFFNTTHVFIGWFIVTWHRFRCLYLMWLFYRFPLAPNFQTTKYESNRSLFFTNLLVLVPAAVIRNGEVASLLIRLKQRSETFLRKYQVYIIFQRWLP